MGINWREGNCWCVPVGIFLNDLGTDASLAAKYPLPEKVAAVFAKRISCVI